MSRDSYRRCFLSLALLLLVSCSLLAFPGRAKREEPGAPTPMAIVTEATAGEVGPQTGSTGPMTSLTDDTGAIVEVATHIVEDAVCLSDGERDELLAIVEASYSDQMEAEDEIQRLASRVEELEAVNADQADTIAREQGSKAYARLTGSVGFEDGLSNPSLWLGGAVGARIGRGLMLDVGAEYRIGSFGKVGTVPLGIENLRFTASVGWEW